MSIDIRNIQKAHKSTFAKQGTGNSFFKKEFTFSRKITDKKKVFIYKDMATLLRAGIDFKSALTIVRDQQNNELSKNVLNNILDAVIKGKSLHEAIDKTGHFSPYEIFSIKIGEETRMLDNILDELQKYFQRKVKLKKQIISILTYPAFILVLTFATLYYLLTYVVPIFESVFNQFDRELPKLTKYVILLSENFMAIFLATLIVAIAIGLLYNFL